jgi:MFS family permease
MTTLIRSSFFPWLMWLLPLLFFAYQFILRLWPGLTMQQIMAQYNIDATGFGSLQSMYYLGYAGFQIPVAILLDRYSPRYVVSALAMLAGCAALMSAYADHWAWAFSGRFLIGLGSAAGFLGVSKAVSEWFPGNKYARMIGYSFSFGLLGAIYGGLPVNAMMEQWGYVFTAESIAIAGIVIGGLVFLIYRHPTIQRKTNNQTRFKINDLIAIVTNPALLLLAVSNLLMVGALEGFADVWGITFLVTAYEIPKSSAAGIISFIYVGMLFGGPVFALCSERLGVKAVIMGCGIGIALLISMILLLCASLDPFIIKIMLLIIGMLCCYQVVVFSACADYASPQALGITIAFINSINMLGGSFFHTVIGYLADAFWNGQMANGCRIYSADTYTLALMIIPACAVLGSLLVAMVRKSK